MKTISADKATPIDIAFTASANGHPDLGEDILRNQPLSDPRIAFNLGYHEWRHGRLAEGLKLMDAGRAAGLFGSKPLQKPTASPGSIDGKTLLLRLEGGQGDEIFNARFAAPISAMGARVVVSCSKGLMSILSRVEGVSAAVSSEVAEAGLIHYDVWVPGMSAGRLLDLSHDKLPRRRYIKPSSTSVAKWGGLVKGGFKVGLRWRGSPLFEHEQHRCFPPARLFDVADVEGVSCYSIQRDHGSEMLPKESKITDLGPFLDTWEDTAGAIANMDLIITSCTSVAHLAGAMGIPTWVIVPVLPYYVWAWPWGSESSPWYSSVRLFRQKKIGEWDQVLSHVFDELKLHARGAGG